MWTAKYWSSLPRGIVEFTSLEILKTQLSNVLSNLTLWACFKQEGGLDDLQRPFSFYIILWVYKLPERDKLAAVSKSESHTLSPCHLDSVIATVYHKINAIQSKLLFIPLPSNKTIIFSDSLLLDNHPSVIFCFFPLLFLSSPNLSESRLFIQIKSIPLELLWNAGHKILQLIWI